MSEKTIENDLAGDDSSGKEANNDSSVGGNKVDEPTAKATAEGKEENEEYPQGLAFAMIMVSVLSSLFLVALVFLSIMPTLPPRD